MLTTRNAAAIAGHSKYFTGKPCLHGHTTPRYTMSGSCVGCVKASNSTLRNVLSQRLQGVEIFTYRLNREDHAAALAFCQALDVQRGVEPSNTQAVAASLPPPPPELATRDARHALWRRIHGETVASVMIASDPGAG